MAPAFGATVGNPMSEQERESLSHFVTPTDQKLSELFLWRVGNCFTHSDSVVRWLRANNWTSYSDLLMADATLLAPCGGISPDGPKQIE